MNYEDEILLEQYFTSKKLNRDQRNFCINILLHTKDVSSSEVLLNSKSSCKYDLLFLNLSKEEGYVKFDGAVDNNDENRMIYGQIVTRGNKVFVQTNIYRCSDIVLDENKEYVVIDEFVFKDDRVIRKSRYDNSYCEDEVELYTEMQIEEYLEDKCNQIRLKR